MSTGGHSYSLLAAHYRMRSTLESTLAPTHRRRALRRSRSSWRIWGYLWGIQRKLPRDSEKTGNDVEIFDSEPIKAKAKN
jgi:hypothetical protein